MKTYDIAIADFNSAGIRAVARELGITHMRLLGISGEGDHRVGFYALPHPRRGWEIRVANTNGDPVWEEEDAQEFAELAEECGINLD